MTKQEYNDRQTQAEDLYNDLTFQQLGDLILELKAHFPAERMTKKFILGFIALEIVKHDQVFLEVA